jgi:hypothetical protein
MRIELITVPQVRSKRTKELSIRALFRISLQTRKSSLEISVMSLIKIYYDPKHTARFSSVEKLVSAAKSSKRNVEEWLSGENTYILHKSVRKRFSRFYILLQILTIWEMDLAELSPLSRYNDIIQINLRRN